MTMDFEMKPLKFGMEITGIDLQQHVDDANLFQRIKMATYEHRLLVFRNQGVIPGQAFVQMCEHFGDVCHDPFIAQTTYLRNHEKSPAPAIMRIANDASEGYKGTGKSGWHLDGTYRDSPFSFLIFNCVSAPSVGDTKFVGFREILSSIDDDTYNRWSRLITEETSRLLGKTVLTAHPLIADHPVTKEQGLIFHLGYTEGTIENYGTASERRLTNEENAAFVAEVTAEINKDDQRLVYSHHWQVGDVVFVDNRQLAHVASRESQLPREEIGLRILHRVGILGEGEPTALYIRALD